MINYEINNYSMPKKNTSYLQSQKEKYFFPSWWRESVEMIMVLAFLDKIKVFWTIDEDYDDTKTTEWRLKMKTAKTM
jgi:hypothetical protein